ncbi:MAG: glycosyltransferase [Candidatus Helarchaeota archaeon]
MALKRSFLFLCRKIGPHQEKVLDMLLKRYNITLLCSNINEYLKYKQYLHPLFRKIAKYTFTNWTLILIAPILVILDTLLYKRDAVIGFFTTTFGWSAAFAVKTPKIILGMGSDLLIDPFDNFFKRIIIKFALKRANGLFIDNPVGLKNAFKLGFNKEYCLSTYGVKIPKKIMKLEERFAKNGETILWTRGVRPVYNIKCFIAALKRLKSIIVKNKVKILIAGNGTNSEEFRKKIDDSQLLKSIKFLGFIKNKKELGEIYQNSTIYVSSSFSDGTSISLLEAMANGITVVVSDFVNNRQWIKDGINGFLFNPLKSDKLAKIIKNLIEQKISLSERQKMITRSYNLVKKKGEIKIVEKNIITLFEKILNKI